MQTKTVIKGEEWDNSDRDTAIYIYIATERGKEREKDKEAVHMHMSCMYSLPSRKGARARP